MCFVCNFQKIINFSADYTSIHMYALSYLLLLFAFQKIHPENPPCYAVADILYVLFNGVASLFQETDFILILVFKPVISVPVYACYPLRHREAAAVIVIRQIIWSRFRQFIWMCSQVQIAYWSG